MSNCPERKETRLNVGTKTSTETLTHTVTEMVIKIVELV